MASTISIDTATEVNIIGITEARSFQYMIEQFEDDTVTPINFNGPCRMEIYYDPAKTKVAKVLTESIGLTRNANELEVALTDDQNTLKPGTYYFDLSDEVDTDNSYIVLRGTKTVNP